ncbi:DUF1566 domain-containing protein [Salinispirillum marinum]|uniref:DUF1566 domain-containing protein n=2 Tax=Saccharospirillaceae TaxID=255527 RepID=A0ABV8BF11_9GAMM
MVTGLENGKLLNLRVEAVSGSSQLAISSQLAVVAGAINDTGEANCISITTGSFPNGISSCDDLPSGANLWPKAVFSNAVNLPSGRAPQQDGNTGRDADDQLIKVGSGKAGFDYTKLGPTGQALPATSTDQECFRDNVTGLVWRSDAGNSALDYDTTIGAAERASACGLTSGWRLPTKAEAESLLQYSRTGVSVDTTWFSFAPQDAWYWTSSPYPAALSGPNAGTGVQNDSLGSNFHNWVINYTTGVRSTFDTNGTGASSSARTLYVNDLSSQ